MNYKYINPNTHRSWSDKGCSLQNDNPVNEGASCSCSHTTNFAILMQVVDGKVSIADNVSNPLCTWALANLDNLIRTQMCMHIFFLVVEFGDENLFSN